MPLKADIFFTTVCDLLLSVALEMFRLPTIYPVKNYIFHGVYC